MSPSTLRTVCVTGTNGKTSTTRLIAAIVESSGQPSAHVTTLGATVAGDAVDYDGSMAAFRAVVGQARERGVRTLAVETTSRALAGGFATRWPPDVAVFTNLSRDHLDRHGTPEAYLAAKARLFFALSDGGVAVLNASDPACALIAENLPAGIRVRGFCVGGPPVDGIEVTLAASEVQAGRDGTEIILSPGGLADALGGSLHLVTPGSFQADNALAAAIASDALGLPPDAIRTGLSRFAGVPGRFEAVSRHPLVVVDYAHTPDALARVLDAARDLVSGAGGKVICVFGCGGDRDRGKRAQMGQCADQRADRVILTTDNPRSEEPLTIARMVRAGASGRARWLEEPDREAAIRRGIHEASPGDAVVIAGRGHETTQLLGTGGRPFSDVEVTRRIVARLASESR